MVGALPNSAVISSPILFNASRLLTKAGRSAISCPSVASAFNGESREPNHTKSLHLALPFPNWGVWARRESRREWYISDSISVSHWFAQVTKSILAFVCRRVSRKVHPHNYNGSKSLVPETTLGPNDLPWRRSGEKEYLKSFAIKLISWYCIRSEECPI